MALNAFLDLLEILVPALTKLGEQAPEIEVSSMKDFIEVVEASIPLIPAEEHPVVRMHLEDLKKWEANR